MTKNELIQFAQNNGMTLEEGMSKKQVADAIFEAGLELPKDKIPVILKYDYWDDNGFRHEKGEAELDVDAAKKLIKEDKAERNDPFPGDA